MEQITTMKELNIFIQEFDNYSFDSDNSTVFFQNSYSHYADQEHNVEGEALAFLLEEEAEEDRALEERLRAARERLEAERKYREEMLLLDEDEEETDFDDEGDFDNEVIKGRFLSALVESLEELEVRRRREEEE